MWISYVKKITVIWKKALPLHKYAFMRKFNRYGLLAPAFPDEVAIFFF